MGSEKNLPDYKLGDYLKHCALGRVGTLDEIARFVAFFVSDDNSYMNGTTVIIDGGGAVKGKRCIVIGRVRRAGERYRPRGWPNEVR